VSLKNPCRWRHGFLLFCNSFRKEIAKAELRDWERIINKIEFRGSAEGRDG